MSERGKTNIDRLPRGTCPCCQRDVALRRGGELREHFHGDPGDIPIKCMGSGLTIAQAQANIDAEIAALRRMSR